MDLRTLNNMLQLVRLSLKLPKSRNSVWERSFAYKGGRIRVCLMQLDIRNDSKCTE